jgi:PAS domain S-box-containing protein
LNTESEKAYILFEQVKKSYQQTTLAVSATLFNAGVLSLILLPVVSAPALLSWLGALMAVICFRLILKARFLRADVQPADVSKWKHLIFISSFLAGSLWGVAAVLLFPSDSFVHQVVIAFVVGGMIAGSVGAFSVLSGTFLSFSLPAMLPLIWRFFYAGDEIHTGMAAMTLLFWLLMWFAARRLNQTIETSIALQYRNTGLIADLRSEIGERKKAEAELREHQKRIEDIVEARTAALVNANSMLSLEIEGRKKTEDALRESEEKYRLLVENINDVIYSANKDAILEFVSPTIENVLGYRPEEVVGQSFLPVFHKQDYARVQNRFQKVLAGELTPQEYRMRRKSGDYCWVRISSRPRYINHLAVGIQGVLTDITDRKLLEAELEQAHKMEAIGTLAGGVAHDLNNILSGLVSYPQLLLMDLPENSPMRDSIRLIQKSGEKAAAIVQDMLTLARRGVPTFEIVPLNLTIMEYLESPEHQNLMAHHSDIEFIFWLEPTLLNIQGSRMHLAKTVMNLVTNAAEAITGKGVVTIETENRYVESEAPGPGNLPEGDYVALRVTDDGNGILPDDINKIFEPFYTKKAMGRSGTGLGMTVVWNTVQDHKGHIEVQSNPGLGTTFTLFFPATREEVAEPAEALNIDTLSGNSESILVVDDVKEQREIASGILRKLGYSVFTAESGEQALACLSGQAFDLLVLDMIMETGMDGLETYEKALALHPGQKAIIVSGFSETERVRQAQKLGAGTYLKKPYLVGTLGYAVQQELRAQGRPVSRG